MSPSSSTPEPAPAPAPLPPRLPPDWRAWARWGAGVLLIGLVVLGLWRWWATSGRDVTPIAWEDLAPPATAPLRPWNAIVIHHSATRKGSVAGIDSAHRQRGWDGIGYHFVIGNGNGMRLGTVEPTWRWRAQREGAHAGGGAQGRPYNQAGIGICCVGQFDEDTPDAWQEERLADLIAELIRHVPTLSSARIIGHGDVPGKDTNCPGKYLDVDRIRRLVRQRLGESS